MRAKIVTVEQMLAIEREADAAGLTYETMMENAGKVIAEAILNRWPEAAGWRAVVLAGPGNNGGDGLVIAHYLSQAGAQVSIYLSRERGADDSNLARIDDGRLIALAADDECFRVLGELIESSDLVIDALLGTGFKLPLEGTPQHILKHVQSELGKRAEQPFIVAVDCPTGLDCDTGEIAAETLPADLTVTLAAAKVGQFSFPGADFVGELCVGDIGIDPGQKSLASVEFDLGDAEAVRAYVPPRPRDSHKGTFGQVVVAGGSINYPGSIALAGGAAYRTGAGLVTLASVEGVYTGLVGLVPEATWILLPDETGVIDESAAAVLHAGIGRATALLIGPGFGLEATTRTFLDRLLSGGSTPGIGFVPGTDASGHVDLPSCVVDADGLKLLVQLENWHERLPGPSVLTPHPGEMSIMTGLGIEDIQSDRKGVAGRFAKTWGHIVVLKGAFTIVAAPDGRCTLMPFATAALAKAGTGDVLAGTIAGLVGQGVDPYPAAVLGCWLHARSARLAADELQSAAGVLAGDLLDYLPLALAELESGILA